MARHVSGLAFECVQDASQRDKRFSCSALCDDCRTPSLLPTLDHAHDPHRLSRKGPPLQLLQCRPDRIVRTMKRGKTRKHKVSERLPVRAEIISDRRRCKHDENSL